MAAHKGHDGQGGGRPKGSPNKVNAIAREAIAAFVDGNADRLVGWLDQIAENDPKDAFNAFMSVVEYHIPKLARQELTGPGGDAIKVEVVNEASARLSRILEDAATAKAAISPEAPRVDRISPPETTPT